MTTFPPFWKTTRVFAAPSAAEIVLVQHVLATLVIRFLIHPGANRASSPIDFPPMPHAVDAYYSNRVGNFVNDAVIANANSPIVVTSGKFSGADWAWILCETIDRRNHTVMHSN